MEKINCEGDVIYSRKVPYCGRNGCFNMTGAYISETSKDNVRIEPITTRDTIGRCWVEIPKEDIPAVIEKLKKYVNSGNNITAAEPLTALKNMRDMLASAHDLHIFDRDDEHPDDCGYCQAIRDAETVIAREESKRKRKIIVDVSGGNVQAVYSSDPDIEVRMCDWDNAACDDEYKAECEKLAEESKNLTSIY